MTNADLLRFLIQTAAAEMARYPQYAGVYEGSGLARIVSNRGLRRRGKATWPVGKLAVGRPAEQALPGEPESSSDVVLYECGYGDCRLPGRCIEWVIPSKGAKCSSVQAAATG